MSSISRSEYKRRIEYLAQMGRNIPLQLILAIQEELLEKVTTWLKANGAPDEVVEAINNADYLQLIAGYIKEGKLSDLEAADLPETIINASGLAVKFGSSFLNQNIGDSQIPSIQR